MARSFLAGMIDYSHQSFEDLIEDLNYWKELCSERAKWIEKSISSLDVIGYWEKIPVDFQSEIYFSKKYFNTVVSEINSIINDFESEVQKNHVKRLYSLAKTADKENKDIGRTWHADTSYDWKDYGNENFDLVEELYGRTRDLVASLTDLSNIATRLNDYTGKMKKKNTTSILDSAQFGDNVTVIFGHGNIVTTTNVKVSQGNFDDLRNTLEKHGVAAIDIDELREILSTDKPDLEAKKFGKGVSDWIEKMISKAAQNIWNIGIGAAGSLLAQALNQYYGWI